MLRLLFLTLFAGILLPQSYESIDENLVRELASSQLSALDRLPSENSKVLDEGEILTKSTDLERKSEYFGYDFFNFKPISSQTALDVPLGNSYTINFNDKVELMLIGSIDRIYDLNVSLSGEISIPNVGLVAIVGLDVEEANKKVNLFLNEKKIGVQGFLSVKNPSLKKISIVGAVKSPGVYLVNPFSSVVEAIRYAGGLDSNASLRDVEIIKKNELKVKLDLYDFLVFGYGLEDLSLDNGDIIRIKSTDNFVKIEGEALRNLYYEYLPSDTYEDLIEFSGGFKKYANKNNISVNALSNGQLVTQLVDISEQIENDAITRMFVGSLSNKRDAYPFVKGESVERGAYQIEKYETLSNLISELSFSDTIYPFFSVLKRFNKNELTTDFMYFSLNDPSTYQEIDLRLNDEIMFFSTEDIVFFSKCIQLVDFTSDCEPLEERRVNSTEIKTNENQSVQAMEINREISKDMDLETQNINNASEKVEDKEIFEPYKSYDLSIFDLKQLLVASGSLKDINYNEQVYSVPTVGELSLQRLFKNLRLIPSVFKNIIYVNLDNSLSEINPDVNIDSTNFSSIFYSNEDLRSIKVTIEGQVKSPGEYVIPADSTLLDLYEISGFFTNSASPNGAVFLRESVKELQERAITDSFNKLRSLSVANSDSASNQNLVALNQLLDMAKESVLGRLSGDLSLESELVSKITLEDNDYIFIPSEPISVNIVGEVASPGSVMFDVERGINDYLEMAGGLKDTASQNQIYVVKFDGSAQTLDKKLFSRSYILEPGDTIVVPIDTSKGELLDLSVVVSGLLSNLALSAAALSQISSG